jgi:UPF0755 protein
MIHADRRNLADARRTSGRHRSAALSRVRGLASAAALAMLAACGGSPHGQPVRFTVPRHAGLSRAADSLAAHGIIGSKTIFKLMGRFGGKRSIKPGVYEVRPGESYSRILDKLVAGDVVKIRLVIPEGWTLQQIAARIAQKAALPADTVLRHLSDPAAAKRLGVPGPTLEGYLYPATYVFPLGTPVDGMAKTMVKRYQTVWTPPLRARADSLGMSERDVVTLASIVEKEAKVWSERPTIAAVYANRMRIGMRLQADPTVQYALGSHQSRLLYSEIQSVAGSPYNTYTHAGLPPGPIASPSKGAIEAVLHPTADPYLYFVARPNGTHVFTKSLAEHNAAKRQAQQEAAAAGVK